MSLSTPLIHADRTPVVLTQERVTTMPPEPRDLRLCEIVDTAVLVVVWALLCMCVLVIGAGVVMLAALAGGAL